VCIVTPNSFALARTVEYFRTSYRDRKGKYQAQLSVTLPWV
jgi:deoxycytidine triphosphate deaminase